MKKRKGQEDIDCLSFWSFDSSSVSLDGTDQGGENAAMADFESHPSAAGGALTQNQPQEVVAGAVSIFAHVPRAGASARP